MKPLKVKTITIIITFLSACCLSSTSEPFREDSSSPLGHSQFALVSLSWLFCRQKETVSISSQVFILFYFDWQLTFTLGALQIYKSVCISWMNWAGFVSWNDFFFSSWMFSEGGWSHPTALYVSDLKPARPRRPWCLYVIVIYLILQTTLNAFLVYKGNCILFLDVTYWRDGSWIQLLIACFFFLLCLSFHVAVFSVWPPNTEADVQWHFSGWRRWWQCPPDSAPKQQSGNQDPEEPPVDTAEPGPHI